MFSEMAQMLVDKKEFSRLPRLFNDGTNLTLLVEPRKRCRFFWMIFDRSVMP